MSATPSRPAASVPGNGLAEAIGENRCMVCGGHARPLERVRLIRHRDGCRVQALVCTLCVASGPPPGYAMLRLIPGSR